MSIPSPVAGNQRGQWRQRALMHFFEPADWLSVREALFQRVGST